MSKNKSKKIIDLVVGLNKVMEVVDIEAFMESEDKVEFIRKRIDVIHSAVVNGKDHDPEAETILGEVVDEIKSK